VPSYAAVTEQSNDPETAPVSVPWHPALAPLELVLVLVLVLPPVPPLVVLVLPPVLVAAPVPVVVMCRRSGPPPPHAASALAASARPATVAAPSARHAIASYAPPLGRARLGLCDSSFWIVRMSSLRSRS
jgi:hypothetical protein